MEQNQINLSQFNIHELKALAYDELIKVNIHGGNLRILNQELIKRQQQGDASATPVVPNNQQ